MLRFVANTIVATVLAAGCVLMPMARAQSYPSYNASVPFAFYIGDTLFPAGTYNITQPAQNFLVFRNPKGVVISYLLVFARQLDRGATTGQLTFNQYGNSYFLRGFSAPDQSSGPHMASACERGRVETRMANKYMAPSSRELALNAPPNQR